MSRKSASKSSDVRIRISKTGLDTYPDISVVCGHAELDREDRDAITNPVLLVEVLSSSTADYDRNEKLDHYKQLDSLCEVLFVAHDAERLEVVSRAGSAWNSRTAGKGEQLELLSLGVTLDVDDVLRDRWLKPLSDRSTGPPVPKSRWRG